MVSFMDGTRVDVLIVRWISKEPFRIVSAQKIKYLMVKRVEDALGMQLEHIRIVFADLAM